MTDSAIPSDVGADDKGAGRRFKLAIAAMVAVAGGLIVWAYWTLGHPPRAMDEMGQAGDFFGGVLNPLLTFLTFLALLYTLVLQRTELQESRLQFKRSADALSEQNSQAAFYQALTIHNDVVGAFYVVDPITKEPARGRDAFRVIYTEVSRLYREKSKKLSPGAEDVAIIHAFEVIYRKHPELAHYFRYLFNTIVLVEKLPKAPQYIKLLRSLLSNHELLLLYYNAAVSPPGKAFQDLAISHKLFDNMPPYLLDDAHAKLLPPAVFGPGGYEAKLATKAPRVRGDLSEAGPPRTRAPRDRKATLLESPASATSPKFKAANSSGSPARRQR